MNSPIYSVYQTVTSYLPRKSWTLLIIKNIRIHINSLAFLKWAPRKKTICDLPDECLANIFSQTMCPSGSHKYKPPSTPFFSVDCRQDPFVLGQVCRKWRNVTLRTSELWCSITIIHPKPCHMHRAELWLQRSGSRPISITIKQSTNPTVAEFDATVALLALFDSRAEFWKSLDLCLNGQFPHILLPRLEDLSEMQSCKLNKVNLTLRSRLPEPLSQEWDAPTIRAWDLLQSIPSITSFRWDAPVVGSARLTYNVNEVEIKTPISMETLSNIIHSAVTLQSIIVHKLSLPSSYPLRLMKRTIYPYLTVLDITASPITSDISNLLGNITLPSLTCLTLAQVQHDILVHVADLIHRSQCTLEVFGIRILNFTEPQIMEWLNMDELKQITCLILEGPITDNILRALHRPAKYGHQHCYFPDLKRLGLGKCVSTIDNGLLLRMLGSRFWTLPYIAGPKLSKTELELACVTVQEVTAEHEAYAEMIKRTTERSSRGSRELEITV